MKPICKTWRVGGNIDYYFIKGDTIYAYIESRNNTKVIARFDFEEGFCSISNSEYKFLIRQFRKMRSKCPSEYQTFATEFMTLLKAALREHNLFIILNEK